MGSPRELKAFATYNDGRPYPEQVKPWGFLAMAYPTTHERARPDGVRCLVAQFERDPARRIAMNWIDRDHPEQSCFGRARIYHFGPPSSHDSVQLPQ